MLRVKQEKIKLECDFIATSRRLEGHTSSLIDTEYYKHTINTLNGRNQSLHDVVAEKDRQLDEMRHQIERNMSEDRWSNISAAERSNRSFL